MFSEPRPLPSLVRAPHQRRSQRVLDQILSATRDLLREMPYESIGVGDIARRAGVSVGVFYTRFTTKDHVLVQLARDFVAETSARARKVLQGVRPRSPADFAEAYFTMAAETFYKHRAVLRPVSLLVRLNPDAELRNIVASFNEVVHRAFREKILEHRHEIAHPNAEEAVNLAILATSAALREVVLYQEPVSRLGPKRRKGLARELARLFSSYLLCPSPARRRSRTAK